MSGTTLRASLLISCSLIAQSVSAQEQSLALEEIVVTATKRSERLQDIPATVNAFSAEYLQDSGITSPQQLLELVPGFAPVVMQERGVAYLSMRGLGRLAGRPTIMYVVDGVEQTGFHGHLINTRELYDIERVEVLKGPQPTLYGRDAVGGVVAILHKQPVDDTEFFGELELGDYDRFAGMAGFNVPLSDSVYVRAHAYHGTREGYNDGLTRENLDGEDYQGGVFRLRIAPSDALDILATVDYFETDTGFARYIRFVTPEDTRSPIRSEELGNDDMERLTSVLNIEYDFGSARFTSATGYSRFDQFFTFDLDFSEHVFFERGQPRDAHTFSQELRLASPDDQRLRWMAGAYYVRERFDDDFNQWIAPFGITAHSLTSAVTTQYSGFLDLEFNLTERLALATGARVAREEVSGESFAGISAGNNILGIPAGTNMTRNTPFEQADTNVLPRATLTFRPSSDLTFFASAAKGITGAQFSSEGINDAERGVDAESAWSYEVGAKAALMDSRLNLSASVYYTEWDGMQFLENIIIGGQRSVNTNAGNSEILGTEVQLLYQPTRSFDFGISASYVDTRVRELVDEPLVNPIRPLAVGDRIPHTPDLTINAYGQYTHELSDELSASLWLDWDYASSRWGAHEAVPFPYSPASYFNEACSLNTSLGIYDCRHELPELSRVNVNLGFEYKKVKVQFFVNNVFDERTPDLFLTFPTNLLGLPEVPAHPGILTPPRTMGVKLRADF